VFCLLWCTGAETHPQQQQQRTVQDVVWFCFLSAPHLLPPPRLPRCVAGAGQDIWEAERGELLHGEGGGEAGDTHQGSLHGRRARHRQGWQNRKFGRDDTCLKLTVKLLLMFNGR